MTPNESEIEAGIEYVRCDPCDFSKLRIKDGLIHYRLYQQDGSMTDMTAPDTLSNRVYISWIQIHDRY